MKAGRKQCCVVVASKGLGRRGRGDRAGCKEALSAFAGGGQLLILSSQQIEGTYRGSSIGSKARQVEERVMMEGSGK